MFVNYGTDRFDIMSPRAEFLGSHNFIIILIYVKHCEIGL